MCQALFKVLGKEQRCSKPGSPSPVQAIPVLDKDTTMKSSLKGKR